MLILSLGNGFHEELERHAYLSYTPRSPGSRYLNPEIKFELARLYLTLLPQAIFPVVCTFYLVGTFGVSPFNTSFTDLPAN